ncbi:MAG: 50S ribosomal protein L6 [Motiliproteus sp.]|nr:50S ribosomal protein L6 [Motiliproteus sp.]MCW9052189.1 50S ribosomal protein L6 [Motiliproteus sp.]
MSRIAKAPISIPSGVTVKVDAENISVKGGKGELSMAINQNVEVKNEDNVLSFAPRGGSRQANAMAGTTRALVNNMVVGVTEGFEKKLELIGVGYRAAAKGKVLNLTLGFSHPIDYQLPEGITAEVAAQTTVILKGADKQKIGQAAAEIRAFRPPEPYKGKGVRYADEYVRRKEAKKK